MLCSNTKSTVDDKDPPSLHACIQLYFQFTNLESNTYVSLLSDVHMCTSEDNGIANEAIVLQRLV